MNDPRLPLPSQLGRQALSQIVDLLYEADFYPPTSRYFDGRKFFVQCVAVMDALNNESMLDLERQRKLALVVDLVVPILEELGVMTAT